jgi:thioredoxin 1
VGLFVVSQISFLSLEKHKVQKTKNKIIIHRYIYYKLSSYLISFNPSLFWQTNGTRMVKLITSASEFSREIQVPGLVVVDFFADWCGPCRNIAPFVESLSVKYPNVKFLKVNVDTCEVGSQRGVRSLPTFQFFVNGNMVDEMKGADQFGLTDRVQRFKVDTAPSFAGQGFALGGGSESTDLRDARLKAFQSKSSGGSSASAPVPKSATDNALKNLILTGDSGNQEEEDAKLARAVALSMVEGQATGANAAASASTASLPQSEGGPPVASTDDGWGEEMVPVPVNEEILAQLVEMDVPEVRARKAIVHGESLEGALAWLEEHQNDPDIDQPYMVKKSDAQPKRVLTEEERLAKVEEMRLRIKQRQEERAQAEKEAEINREKDRRERGKTLTEVQEERDKLMRRREAEKQKKEKQVIQYIVTAPVKPICAKCFYSSRMLQLKKPELKLKSKETRNLEGGTKASYLAFWAQRAIIPQPFSMTPALLLICRGLLRFQTRPRHRRRQTRRRRRQR